jgi:hypothetical protein
VTCVYETVERILAMSYISIHFGILRVKHPGVYIIKSTEDIIERKVMCI